MHALAPTCFLRSVRTQIIAASSTRFPAGNLPTPFTQVTERDLAARFVFGLDIKDSEVETVHAHMDQFSPQLPLNQVRA